MEEANTKKHLVKSVLWYQCFKYGVIYEKDLLLF